MKTLTKTLAMIALMVVVPLVTPGADATEKSGVYQPGQLLVVEHDASPGQHLQMTLPGLAPGLAMKEERPGHYVGRFMVLPSMCPYSGLAAVRTFDDRVLKEQKVVFAGGSDKPVQAAVADDGTLCFAFDATISGGTVKLADGPREVEFPTGLKLENNFFTYDGEWDETMTIKARTVRGRPLEFRLSPLVASL